jgi:hypothetical protein
VSCSSRITLSPASSAQMAMPAPMVPAPMMAMVCTRRGAACRLTGSLLASRSAKNWWRSALEGMLACSCKNSVTLALQTLLQRQSGRIQRVEQSGVRGLQALAQGQAFALQGHSRLRLCCIHLPGTGAGQGGVVDRQFVGQGNRACAGGIHQVCGYHGIQQTRSRQLTRALCLAAECHGQCHVAMPASRGRRCVPPASRDQSQQNLGQAQFGGAPKQHGRGMPKPVQDPPPTPHPLMAATTRLLAALLNLVPVIGQSWVQPVAGVCQIH